jgi:uncharacterized protein YecA (UPF0149 family)
MIWNPIDKLKKKFGLHDDDSPEPKAKKVPKEVAELTKEGVPDFKELEKKGMLGKFYRYWKDPAFKKQLQAVAERMKADGVNVKDQNAVKAWVESHQKEIESGKLETSAAPKVETFKKDGPAVGRNDPCTCGSRKKFKKCCG